MKFYLALVFVFFLTTLPAQVLRGKVVDENNQPLASANVYFDQTTVGVITDFDGNFTLEVPSNVAKPILVISYLGYTSYRLEDLNYFKSTYQLKPKPESLENVEVYTNLFTRKQMERVFLKYFLGTGKARSRSKVLNLDDVVLYYVGEENTLYAKSFNPIEVENKYLGYHVRFDLIDFEVKYRTKTLDDEFLRQTYYAGNTFFKDINPNKAEVRDDVYNSSLKNFFKHLAEGTLDKTEYKLLYREVEEDPYAVFEVIKPEDPSVQIMKVKLQPEYITYVNDEFVNKKFVLVHRGLRTTLLFEKPSFRIDKRGNLIDIKDVVLSGGLANSRVAKLLPLEYRPSLQD